MAEQAARSPTTRLSRSTRSATERYPSGRTTGDFNAIANAHGFEDSSLCSARFELGFRRDRSGLIRPCPASSDSVARRRPAPTGMDDGRSGPGRGRASVESQDRTSDGLGVDSLPPCGRRSRHATGAKVGMASARPQYAHAVAETSYASCGNLSLAYQVFGDGPVELVFVGPMVSHVELFWTMPEFKAYFDQLATFCRVLLFDKAGVGLWTPSRKFDCSKSEPPRSRPSWTPSASQKRPSSV